MDILGPFLLAKAQKKFMIVACKYFTKCVETEAILMITQKIIEKLLWINIVCRFGVSNRIIIYNRPQLKGKKVAQFCSNLHITLALTLVSHP